MSLLGLDKNERCKHALTEFCLAVRSVFHSLEVRHRLSSPRFPCGAAGSTTGNLALSFWLFAFWAIWDFNSLFLRESSNRIFFGFSANFIECLRNSVKPLLLHTCGLYHWYTIFYILYTVNSSWVLSLPTARTCLYFEDPALDCGPHCLAGIERVTSSWILTPPGRWVGCGRDSQWPTGVPTQGVINIPASWSDDWCGTHTASPAPRPLQPRHWAMLNLPGAWPDALSLLGVLPHLPSLLPVYPENTAYASPSYNPSSQLHFGGT